MSELTRDELDNPPPEVEKRPSSLDEAIDNGVAMLDWCYGRAEWLDVVDLDDLDMQSSCGCMLGQTVQRLGYGMWLEVDPYLEDPETYDFLDFHDFNGELAHSAWWYGFDQNPSFGDPYGGGEIFDYHQLDKAWIQKVSDLRAGTGGS